jgi:ribosomal protein S18 acetylase RimI-like enzyme
MTLRTASLSDLPAVAALEAACFPPAEAAGEASLRARLTSFPDCFWLLFQGETLVAMVNGMATDQPDLTDEMYDRANLHDPKGAWQMIFGVDTHPHFRRQGHASALLRAVIQEARKRGKQGLVLTCKAHLLGFYGALGFVSEGVSQSVHGGAVWYQMRLTF